MEYSKDKMEELNLNILLLSQKVLIVKSESTPYCVVCKQTKMNHGEKNFYTEIRQKINRKKVNNYKHLSDDGWLHCTECEHVTCQTIDGN